MVSQFFAKIPSGTHFLIIGLALLIVKRNPAENQLTLRNLAFLFEVSYTLPDTNISPENERLEDEIPFEMTYFSGANC